MWPAAVVLAVLGVAAVVMVEVVRADYHLLGGEMSVQSSTYMNGTLQFDTTKPGSPYGRDTEFLAIHVYYDTDSRLHVKIHDLNASDAAAAEWQVPYSLLNIAPDAPPIIPEYVFDYTASPFTFSVRRTFTNELLWDTDSSTAAPIPGGDTQPWLVYSPQYLSITTTLSADSAIYGLGEHITSLRLPLDRTYTLWNRDQGNPRDVNLYGSHPMYLRLDTSSTDPAKMSGHVHGMLMWNSNAMDVTLGQNNMTWRMTGGVLDMFWFMGLTPEDVSQQYTRLVGKPYMPPLWALGFHQCRWGYQVIGDTANVVNQYVANGIPLDTVWNDIGMSHSDK